MKNQELFLVPYRTSYPRKQQIEMFLEGINLSKFRILPPFNKRAFIKNIHKRDFIINDFFTSDFESLVIDRKLTNPVGIKAAYYYSMDYINFRFSKFILSDTKTHLNYWKKLFGNTKASCFILPVLANPHIYKPFKNTQNKEPTVLFFGTFIPLHGIDKILKAFQILQKKHTQITLQIIGSGQTDKEAKKLINQYNLKKVLFINERIPEWELSLAINKAHIILGIFGDSEKAKSVVPNKVFQGVACRKCVITMDSPAVREFFSEQEIKLVKNNPSSIAEGIEYLMDNHHKIDELSEQGFSKFKQLYETSKREFRSFVRKIVNNGI